MLVNKQNILIKINNTAHESENVNQLFGQFLLGNLFLGHSAHSEASQLEIMELKELE